MEQSTITNEIAFENAAENNNQTTIPNAMAAVITTVAQNFGIEFAQAEFVSFFLCFYRCIRLLLTLQTL